MRFSPVLRPLILASASPRRKTLLKQLGEPFEISPVNIEEKLFLNQSPEENAEQLARQKARAMADILQKGTVIGCDTIVAVGDEILGKPDSIEDARRILSILSGKTQRVISGLSLIHVETGVELSGYDVTTVYTKHMTDQDIEAYIATGECFGKAGAYAIQETGDRFIERLEGSFDNVVGFPTELYLKFIKELEGIVEDAQGKTLVD